MYQLYLVAFLCTASAINQGDVDIVKAVLLGVGPSYTSKCQEIDPVTGKGRSVCASGDFIGASVRLAFHDAAGNGGANGCIDFKTEDNNGLQDIVALYEPVYQRFKADLSRADLWALAAFTVVEQAKGPRVTFRYGRVDATVCNIGEDQGFLPDATLGWDHVRAVFQQRMGFSVQEIVSLMGAHSLGRAEMKNSGFEGPWSITPTILGRKYYISLNNTAWNKTVSPVSGKPAWHSPPGNNPFNMQLMLNTDLSMLYDPLDCEYVQPYDFNGTKATKIGSCTPNDEARPFVLKYATTETAFFTDFAKAFQKLSEMEMEEYMKDIGEGSPAL